MPHILWISQVRACFRWHTQASDSLLLAATHLLTNGKSSSTPSVLLGTLLLSFYCTLLPCWKPLYVVKYRWEEERCIRLFNMMVQCTRVWSKQWTTCGSMHQCCTFAFQVLIVEIYTRVRDSRVRQTDIHTINIDVYLTSHYFYFSSFSVSSSHKAANSAKYNGNRHIR